MKKLLLSAVLCLVAVVGRSQELFEGMLRARSYERHSNFMIKASKGTLQNGSRDVESYFKGNKLASWDKLVNAQTIYDLDEEVIYMVFHEIRKTVVLSSTMFSEMPYHDMAIKPVPTGETKTILGLTCRRYVGEDVDMKIRSEAWLCEELRVSEELAPYVSANTGLPMIGLKYIIESGGSILGGVMNLNTYNVYYIKEIDRSPVPDEKFAVPQDYKVVYVSGVKDKALRAAFSENEKALKKNKKLSTKEEDVIKFDIDEEWDF